MKKEGKIARYSLGLAMAAITTLTILGLGSVAPARAQVTTPNWSYTGSLNAARAGHSATLLPNGKVLVIGGALPLAELYDPSTGSWGLISFNPHVHGCGTLLPTGKLLLAGDGTGSAELYDPSTGTFTATGSMTEPAFCGSATLLSTGNVLITTWVPAGPIAVRAGTPELYDPSTGTFSSTGRFVDTGAASVYGDSGLVAAPATLLLNGKVLLAAEPTAQLYDPVSGTFSLTGAMTTPCGYGNPSYIVERTATLLRNGKVLVTGGANQDEECGLFKNAELYDPSTGTFTATSDMTRPRAYHTATLLPNGTVLITGGETYDCNNGRCFFAGSAASTEIFDPSTGTFNLISNMNARREFHTATLLNNGQVLVAGGLDYGTGIGDFRGSVASAELYDPNAAIPTPKIISASLAGKKLFVLGENFDAGAVILINGEEQVTKNDSENPQTRLLGKNAGKKVKPGDTLQVRNLNGALSDAFIFTGS